MRLLVIKGHITEPGCQGFHCPGLWGCECYSWPCLPLGSGDSGTVALQVGINRVIRVPRQPFPTGSLDDYQVYTSPGSICSPAVCERDLLLHTVWASDSKGSGRSHISGVFNSSHSSWQHFLRLSIFFQSLKALLDVDLLLVRTWELCFVHCPKMQCGKKYFGSICWNTQEMVSLSKNVGTQFC